DLANCKIKKNNNSKYKMLVNMRRTQNKKNELNLDGITGHIDPLHTVRINNIKFSISLDNY
ncbi:LOW QUALITY PROTEIN: hypothetical protein HZS_5534, partial [Henneguya salminicola]